MALHLSSEERQIIDHAKKVGKNIGFVVGAGLGILAFWLFPMGGLANIMTSLGLTGISVSFPQIFSTVGKHATQGLLPWTFAQTLGGAVFAGVGGWIGSTVGANKAEENAIRKIQNLRERSAEMGMQQAQYMAMRAPTPEISYGQGRAGSLGNRYLSEPEQGTGRGVN